MADRLFHLFFISQSQTFNVGGTDYNAWVVTTGGKDYYFMCPGDPRPEGYTVRDVVGIIASSGANDMLYFVTRNKNVAAAASVADEFAGGSNTSTASAWLSFALLSYEQKGAHSAFPKGAAAKLAIPAKWDDGGMQSGTFGEWLAAGAPMDSFHVDVRLKILGVE